MNLRYFWETDFNHISDRTVLLDVDGTVVASHDTYVRPEVKEAVLRLSERNEVILFSNNMRRARLPLVARELRVPYVVSGRAKPNPRLVTDIHANFPLVVVGDKMTTDGLFAYLVGVPFIQVKCIRTKNDSWAAKLVYVLDDSVGLCVKMIKRFT